MPGISLNKKVYLIFLLVFMIALSACQSNSSSPSQPAVEKEKKAEEKEEVVDPLAAIIEGAKKEGTVVVSLSSQLEGDGIKRLQREIKDKFDIDLDIKFTAGGSYPKRIADDLTEHKLGLPPTYDLIQYSDSFVYLTVVEGLAKKVNWEPLLLPGTPKEAIQFDGHALTLYTAHNGLIYNSNIISEAEIPKKLNELSDPKWSGKIALPIYTENYARFAIVRDDHQSVLADLTEIMKNNPVFGTYAQNLPRFTSGEYPMQFTISNYYNNIKNSGLPVKWAPIEFSSQQVHAIAVTERAAHPNAAMLIALYLASPDGHKLMLEEANAGSTLYPGNFEHDIFQDDVKAGVTVFNPMEWSGALDFFISEEGKKLEEEIGKIILNQ